jgi:hypothetical protein
MSPTLSGDRGAHARPPHDHIPKHGGVSRAFVKVDGELA